MSKSVSKEQIKILDREHLWEQFQKSVYLYSYSSLNTLRAIARIRVFQAPSLEKLFAKMGRKEELNKEETKELQDSISTENHITNQSLISQCSTFDAFLLDLETILLLIEYRGKLIKSSISIEKAINLSKDDILLSSARSEATKRAFQGIKKRLISLHDDFSLEKKFSNYDLDLCEEIFEKRNFLVHAPFSFSKTKFHDNEDELNPNEKTVELAESNFGKLAHNICTSIIEKKFKKEEPTCLLLLKKTFMEDDEISKEFKAFGIDIESIDED